MSDIQHKRISWFTPAFKSWRVYYYYPQQLVLPIMWRILIVIGFLPLVGILAFSQGTNISLWDYALHHMDDIWNNIILTFKINYMMQVLVGFLSGCIEGLCVVAMVLLAASHFKHKPVGIFAALREACTHWKLMIVYAVLEALVALQAGSALAADIRSLLILSFISSAVLSFFLFFLVPLMVFERLSVVKAVAKSVCMMRYHFVTVLKIFLGIMFWGITVLLFPLCLFGLFRRHRLYPLWAVFILVLMLGVVVAFLLSAHWIGALPAQVKSAASTVFKIYGVLTSALGFGLLQINKTAFYFSLHGHEVGTVDNEKFAELVCVK
jgi:hypothetical protein